MSARLPLVTMFVMGSVGCGHRHEPEASPLGVLAESEIADWSSDCPTPLLDDRVCGGSAWTRDCDTVFHSVDVADKTEAHGTSAIRRIACKPRGWALWTDPLGRIVAICTDDDLPTEVDWQRMKRLVTKHRGSAAAQAIYDYVAAKIRDPAKVPNWHAWQQPIDPANPGSPGESMCVEFRLGK